MGYLVLALVLGVSVYAVALWFRRRAGLGFGETVAMDNVLLSSDSLELTGRPDRILRTGKYYIPEEKKGSASKVHPCHRAQIGAYCLLVEEKYGVRPPYGVMVLADGTRQKIRNTKKLRAWVLRIAREIKHESGETPLAVFGEKPQCNGCSQKNNCSK